MAPDSTTQECTADLQLLRREVMLRARAERRLVEQEIAVRWSLLAIAAVCALCGTGLLIAGDVLGGATALASATGSGMVRGRIVVREPPSGLTAGGQSTRD